MSDHKLMHMFRAVGEGGSCLGCRFNVVVLEGCSVWGC